MAAWTVVLLVFLQTAFVTVLGCSLRMRRASIAAASNRTDPAGTLTYIVRVVEGGRGRRRRLGADGGRWATTLNSRPLPISWPVATVETNPAPLDRCCPAFFAPFLFSFLYSMSFRCLSVKGVMLLKCDINCGLSAKINTLSCVYGGGGVGGHECEGAGSRVRARVRARARARVIIAQSDVSGVDNLVTNEKHINVKSLQLCVNINRNKLCWVA